MSLSPSDSKRIDAYWIYHYAKKVSKYWHAVCSSITGIKDERYMPGYIFGLKILPFFNRDELIYAYSDINIADMILMDNNVPRTIIKIMNGYYINGNNKMITSNIALNQMLGKDIYCYIKPSFLGCGEKVMPLHIVNKQIFIDNLSVSFKQLENIYGNDFIIQEKIEQQPVMSEFYPHSVNTLRMVTLRFKNNFHL